MLSGQPHKIDLRMTCAVTASNYCIFRLQQYLIMFIYQQRAKRMIAVVARLLCNGYGSSQMLKVGFVHVSILKV